MVGLAPLSRSETDPSYNNEGVISLLIRQMKLFPIYFQNNDSSKDVVCNSVSLSFLCFSFVFEIWCGRLFCTQTGHNKENRGARVRVVVRPQLSHVGTKKGVETNHLFSQRFLCSFIDFDTCYMRSGYRSKRVPTIFYISRTDQIFSVLLKFR